MKESIFNFEFINLIRPIIQKENYKLMKKYVHHKNISTYRHSIKVCYLVYLHVKKHNSNVDLNSIIRGALLHDYYLYDWHHKDKSHSLHGYKHPKFSLINATKDYQNINNIEKDIIKHHMFPLTIIPPKTKEGWIVSWCDKLASISDYFRKKRSK